MPKNDFAPVEKCREVRHRLTAYVQGRLTLSRSQQIYAHLSQCPVCRNIADTMAHSATTPSTPAHHSFALSTGILAAGAAALFLIHGFFPAFIPMAASNLVLASSSPQPTPQLSHPAGNLTQPAGHLPKPAGHLPKPAGNPAQPLSHSSRPTGHFAGKAGAAYYILLYVSNRSAAEKIVARLLAESPVLKSEGPYAGRFYLTATPKQLTIFMEQLAKVGDAGITQVGRRRLWAEDPPDPNACSATLDLMTGTPDLITG